MTDRRPSVSFSCYPHKYIFKFPVENRTPLQLQLAYWDSWPALTIKNQLLLLFGPLPLDDRRHSNTVLQRENLATHKKPTPPYCALWPSTHLIILKTRLIQWKSLLRQELADVFEKLLTDKRKNGSLQLLSARLSVQEQVRGGMRDEWELEGDVTVPENIPTFNYTYIFSLSTFGLTHLSLNKHSAKS